MDQEFPLEDFLLLRYAFAKCCKLGGVPVTGTEAPPMPAELQTLYETDPVSPAHLEQQEGALAWIVMKSFPNLRPLSMHFFRSMIAKMRCNNYGFLSRIQTVFAHGLFPKTSMFNHSCCGQVVVVYNGGVQELRIVKPVKAGDELMHAYVDVTATTEERKKKLKELYDFECRCPRCMGTLPYDEGGIPDSELEEQ
jgi:hypothetical protein